MARGSGEGARIRAMRQRAEVSQAALARAAGISPSYLNLIEHGRRPVGGSVRARLAHALGCDPAELSRGAEGALLEGARRAAAEAPAETRPDGAEALVAAHPAWAALVGAQAERIAALERLVARLGDRLGHDPALSASVHDLLSVATAIRATSTILTDDAALDPEWQRRFHRNLHEDSGRLAESARRLAGHLDAETQPEREPLTPQDEVEAWLRARGFHVAELERPGGDPATLARALPDGPGRQLLEGHLRRYAADARALPLDRLGAEVARWGCDPFRIASAAGVDPILAMRRLAAAPEPVTGRALGVVLCDGAGALTLRKGVAGFDVPRFGAGCALWPLYEALRQARPIRVRLRQPGRAAPVLLAHAAGAVRHPEGPDGPSVAEAAMLLSDAPAEEGGAALAVGVACRICDREACPARREPSVLQGADG